MPRGLSRCRICGKLIPSVYRPFHEKHQCREMRLRRGEALPPVRAKPEPEKLKGLDPWLAKEVK